MATTGSLQIKNGKYYAATGTTGFRWLESEIAATSGNEEFIDRSYYDKLVNDAVDAISQYGDFEWFVKYAKSKSQRWLRLELLFHEVFTRFLLTHIARALRLIGELELPVLLTNMASGQYREKSTYMQSQR